MASITLTIMGYAIIIVTIALIYGINIIMKIIDFKYTPRFQLGIQSPYENIRKRIETDLLCASLYIEAAHTREEKERYRLLYAEILHSLIYMNKPYWKRQGKSWQSVVLLTMKNTCISKRNELPSWNNSTKMRLLLYWSLFEEDS